KFILAQQTVVYKDAIEIGSYGSVDQCRGNCGVHTAAECHNHLAVAYLILDTLNSLLDKCGGCPILLATTDINHEILKKLTAFGAMRDLRVKLDAIYRLLCVVAPSFIGGHRYRLSSCDDGEVSGKVLYR